MIGERYTLTLRHEIVDLETHERHDLEPPLSIRYSIYDPMEHGNVIYCVNEMLHKLEKEFLNRLDGEI